MDPTPKATHKLDLGKLIPYNKKKLFLTRPNLSTVLVSKCHKHVIKGATKKDFINHFNQLCPNFPVPSTRTLTKRSCSYSYIKQIKCVYHLSQIICCQTYYASMDNLDQKFLDQPVEVFITSFLLLVYLILLVPLYIKRRKNEQQDQPINFNQIPKSLESLLMNFGIITTSLLMWILLYVMNRYGSVQSS